MSDAGARLGRKKATHKIFEEVKDIEETQHKIMHKYSSVSELPQPQAKSRDASACRSVVSASSSMNVDDVPKSPAGEDFTGRFGSTFQDVSTSQTYRPRRIIHASRAPVSYTHLTLPTIYSV
eukprot:TRINITY_DN13895_c0_g1_i2.p2 TRINITY_DN13895_c0_g1~~TRINITY_DN13895_c0_g1_i2.p2  ORF type:complete len:122 (+),score=13.64 TRINITY_DN13895_c0_g1_i2:448-813(+)